MVVGVVLLLAGVVMLFTPGQGLLTIALAVFVLAPNSRLANWMRARGRDAKVWWNRRHGERRKGGEP